MNRVPREETTTTTMTTTTLVTRPGCSPSSCSSFLSRHLRARHISGLRVATIVQSGIISAAKTLIEGNRTRVRNEYLNFMQMIRYFYPPLTEEYLCVYCELYFNLTSWEKVFSLLSIAYSLLINALALPIFKFMICRYDAYFLKNKLSISMVLVTFCLIFLRPGSFRIFPAKTPRDSLIQYYWKMKYSRKTGDVYAHWHVIMK